MNAVLLVLTCSLLPAYFTCNAKWQNIILLILSAAFAWCVFPYESYILMFVLLFLYAFGRILSKRPSATLSFVICLSLASILFFLREYSLVVRSAISFLLLNSVALLHLSMKQEHLPPFIEGGLYLFYFPKIICGPYEKPEDFLAALNSKRFFSFSAVIKGFALILLGVLERYALAGNISSIRERLFIPTSQISVADLFMSGVLFGFELFFIISAFTNWAKGSSLIFGLPLSDNFRFPFLATSVSDFWRRWHVSVHVWMKDHIYLPLTRKKRSLVTCLAVTFLVSALWHKPTSGFLVWGILAALLTLIEKKAGLIHYPRYLAVPFVIALTGTVWVFFEIEDISFLISEDIQLQTTHAEAYPGIFVAVLIAFVTSLFCEFQGALIEKHSFHFTFPLFLVDFVLLLVLWPSMITVNSIYGF